MPLNLLFGLAVAAGSVFAVWLLLKIIPDEVHDLVPEEYRKWVPIAERTFMVLVVLVAAYNVFQTYGPRLTITAISPPEPPITVTVDLEDVPPLIDDVDRIGQFDDRIEDDDPRLEGEE